MFPIQIPTMYAEDPNAQRAKNIASMEAHVRRIRHFAFTVYCLLKQILPKAEPDLLEQIREAWVSLQTADISEQITELKAAPPIEQHPMYTASPEQLVNLQSQRERIEQQISQMETGMEKLAELAPGLDAMFRGFIFPMLESQRDNLDLRIGEVQKQLDEQPQKEEPK